MKVIDTVPGERSLHKIHRYGIKSKIRGLIRSFLTNRSYFVMTNGCISELVNVKSCIVPKIYLFHSYVKKMRDFYALLPPGSS